MNGQIIENLENQAINLYKKKLRNQILELSKLNRFSNIYYGKIYYKKEIIEVILELLK